MPQLVGVSTSPDPLSLAGSSSPPLAAPNRNMTAPRTKSPRKRPVVEIQSPRKRRTSMVPPDESFNRSSDVTASTGQRIRTPLAKPSPNRTNLSPTPKSKSARSVEPLLSPKYEAPGRTPIRTSRKKETLASSIRKGLPTPTSASLKRQRPSSPLPQPESLPSSSSPENTLDRRKILKPVISRDAFLANEKLKTQREARNFVYDGDSNAPRLTRSGKVVGDTTGPISNEYGEVEGDEDEERKTAGDDEMEPEPISRDALDDDVFSLQPLRVTQNLKAEGISPTPASARPYLLQILATVTSQDIARDPPPFHEEEKNEPLHGLLNLLKGTMERGEGNSALVVGSRGAGKTRSVARALSLLPSSSTNQPIIVRLSGHSQTNDKLAIREIGRQIAEAEGIKIAAEEEDEPEDEEDHEYAPTTLPSHLLALLTSPSPRSIIIVMEEFDLFTEHARQALLYCLLDVVQSIRTGPGPVGSSGRGVALIGVTSRVDTLLLLEKRVKSRFSHRMWRVASPLSSEGLGWKSLLRNALLPWTIPTNKESPKGKEVQRWVSDWQFAVETLLDQEKVAVQLDRLASLTTDVRILYKPFILPISTILSGQLDFLSVAVTLSSIVSQVDLAGWGALNTKLKGLSQPALGSMIIAKHLHYAGRDEFNFAQVEDEYLKFSRTKLVGSGRTRWPVSMLRLGFESLLAVGLLAPAGSSSVKRQFAKVRCTLSPHEIVAWIKGDGGVGLGPELVGWGRMMGGHA